jgi:hypothetical protein
MLCSTWAVPLPGTVTAASTVVFDSITAFHERTDTALVLATLGAYHGLVGAKAQRDALLAMADSRALRDLASGEPHQYLLLLDNLTAAQGVQVLTLTPCLHYSNTILTLY